MAIDTKLYPNKIKNNLWSNKDYSIYYYNFTQDTKKHRGLIDLSDKFGWSKKDKISVAEGKLIEIKNNKKNGVITESIKLDVYMEKYFNNTRAGTAEYQRKMKSHYNRYVSIFFGKKKLVDIRQHHIRECIAFQESKGLAPRTIKQTFEVLNPVFKNAIADRLIVHNPTDGIKIKIPKTKKIVTYASKKLKQIHEAIYITFASDPFYLSLFLFALQGRRKSEILTLRWEDIVFEHNYYVLRDTKNDEEQKIYLPLNIKEELSKFSEVDGWVFKSPSTNTHMVDVRKAVGKIKKELGDDIFGLHYLRNVIVSAMAESGIDSIHLSGALGHNDPNTIKKYLTMNYLKSSEMASELIEGIVSKT